MKHQAFFHASQLARNKPQFKEAFRLWLPLSHFHTLGAIWGCVFTPLRLSELHPFHKSEKGKKLFRHSCSVVVMHRHPPKWSILGVAASSQYGFSGVTWWVPTFQTLSAFRGTGLSDVQLHDLMYVSCLRQHSMPKATVIFHFCWGEKTQPVTCVTFVLKIKCVALRD